MISSIRVGEKPANPSNESKESTLGRRGHDRARVCGNGVVSAMVLAGCHPGTVGALVDTPEVQTPHALLEYFFEAPAVRQDWYADPTGIPEAKASGRKQLTRRTDNPVRLAADGQDCPSYAWVHPFLPLAISGFALIISPRESSASEPSPHVL